MELVMDGVKLAAVGLGAVAGFLVVVIGAIYLNRAIAKPFEHLLEPKKEAASAPKGGNDEKLRMAAAAAIAAHRHGK